MADMELIRVIALEDEASAPDDGQYLLTDTAEGTKKMKAVKLLQNEAQTFDTSANYAAGDYVLYNGRLYCFTAAHAAGVWTGEDADAVTITDRVEGLEEDAADIHAALETKAEIDGYYEKMTVGDAEQLIGTVFIEDRVPYNFRPSGGSNDIGNREYDEVIGGTHRWNQLVYSVNAASEFLGITRTAVGQNGLRVFGTASQTELFTISGIFPIINGHKYFLTIGNVTLPSGSRIQGSTADKATSVITLASTSTNTSFGLYIQNGVEIDVTVYPQVIDLTAILGLTIADYIYSLEQANSGAGVAWFRKLFPMPYYTYNSGELMSVQAASHDTIGFNAWDEEWEVGGISNVTGEKNTDTSRIRSKNYVPVIDSATYFIKDFGVIACFDADKNYLGNVQYTSVSGGYLLNMIANTRYILFSMMPSYGTTYKNDICINLSWDGERDGDYEPYVKHTYPLADLTLRGIAKLDANNQLYYDGDIYASNGTVTRKYGVVDLGTLTWGISNNGNYFQGELPLSANGSYSGLANVICSKYPTISIPESLYNGTVDKVMIVNTTYLSSTKSVFIRDSAYSDAASFKAAMSGVMLVYELATPLTEQVDPFTSPQVVDDFGTEEYVDAAFAAGTRDVAIPVGHITRYTANLRAKLEMAPDSPDGDGDYIVRQTHGENTYVPLVIPTELPAAPSGDGTYVLKATVSGGAATYSWISE